MKDIIIREWVPPKLLVLTRNRPEEAVLTACKGLLGTSGSSSAFNLCGLSSGAGSCDICVSLGSS